MQQLLVHIHFMENHMNAKEMMVRAIDRAVGYANDEKLYKVHLFYAQELGELAGHKSQEVLKIVREKMKVEVERGSKNSASFNKRLESCSCYTGRRSRQGFPQIPVRKGKKGNSPEVKINDYAKCLSGLQGDFI